MSLYGELTRRLREGEFNYAFSISLKHRYVYVENAKAACTTIKSILGEWEFADCDLGAEIPVAFLSNVHVNVLGTPFVKPFQLGEVAFNQVLEGGDFTRFTFVRNPFVRILSAYLDKIVRKTPDADQIFEEAAIRGVLGGDEEVTFLEFLRCIASIRSRSGFLDKHWRPQHLQVFPERIRYDVVGKVETLDHDIAQLAARLGQKAPTVTRSHGHETSASMLVDQYYGDKEVALLLDLYEGDFAAFDYEVVPPRAG